MQVNHYFNFPQGCASVRDARATGSRRTPRGPSDKTGAQEHAKLGVSDGFGCENEEISSIQNGVIPRPAGPRDLLVVSTQEKSERTS